MAYSITGYPWSADERRDADRAAGVLEVIGGRGGRPGALLGPGPGGGAGAAAACWPRRRTHHEPKAKNLLIIFLTGGFSHVDTFDYKPALARYHGKSVPSFGLRPDETHDRPLMGSPFRFRACGESGLMISELFPHLGSMADELCVIRSLHTDIVEHFQAVLAMHTGSATVPMPSLGAWISYGLGTFEPEPARVRRALRAPAVRRHAGLGQQLPAAASTRGCGSSRARSRSPTCGRRRARRPWASWSRSCSAT